MMKHDYSMVQVSILSEYGIDIPQTSPSISIFPLEDVVEGVYWKAGLPVTFQVFDQEHTLVYEETREPEVDVPGPGETFLRFDLAAR